MSVDIIKTLKEIPNSSLLENEPLSRYLGFRTGGPARAVFVPRSRDSFLLAIKELKKAEQRFFVLGNGSNMLAPDAGYDGVIVLTRSALDAIETGENQIHCGAGASLASVCRAALNNGLSGLEFAYGIPGTVGGGVFMNAGAYGGEMKDVVTRVEVLLPSGELTYLNSDELEFGYRTSALQSLNAVVLSADILLKPGDKADISEKMEDFMQRRKAKQPLDLPSCGSVFKRPQGAFAGALIEGCGLRGYRIGGAQVSEKHCGFIVNAGGATSADITALIKHVHDIVLKDTGYDLECEIRMLG